MKPYVFQLDNRDDRREAWKLLDHLAPRDRYRFVQWCCRGCAVGKVPPQLFHTRADLERLERAERHGGPASFLITNECYGYLWTLAVQYKLDLERAIVILEAVTRGRLTLAELDSYTELELVPCGFTPS